MIHYGMTKTAQLAISRETGRNYRWNGHYGERRASRAYRIRGASEFVTGLAAKRGIDRSAVETEFFRQVRPSSILRRFERPEEAAALVAFICSPLASAINGATLRVDRGVVRSLA